MGEAGNTRDRGRQKKSRPEGAGSWHAYGSYLLTMVVVLPVLGKTVAS